MECLFCEKFFSNKTKTWYSLHLPYKREAILLQALRQILYPKLTFIHSYDGPYRWEALEMFRLLQSYRFSDLLNRHKWQHRENKPYKWSFCEKQFVVKKELDSHTNAHKSETPFKCTFCDKFWGSNQSLAGHIRHHTGEKSYDCKVCQKTYLSRSNLNEDLKRHTNIRKHSCNICRLLFLTKRDAQLHNKVHTQSKIPKCRNCGKDFAQKYIWIDIIC